MDSSSQAVSKEINDYAISQLLCLGESHPDRSAQQLIIQNYSDHIKLWGFTCALLLLKHQKARSELALKSCYQSIEGVLLTTLAWTQAMSFMRSIGPGPLTPKLNYFISHLSIFGYTAGLSFIKLNLDITESSIERMVWQALRVRMHNVQSDFHEQLAMNIGIRIPPIIDDFLAQNDSTVSPSKQDQSFRHRFQ